MDGRRRQPPAVVSLRRLRRRTSVIPGSPRLSEKWFLSATQRLRGTKRKYKTPKLVLNFEIVQWALQDFPPASRQTSSGLRRTGNLPIVGPEGLETPPYGL